MTAALILFLASAVVIVVAGTALTWAADAIADGARLASTWEAVRS